jgi:hypothetical protein
VCTAADSGKLYSGNVHHAADAKPGQVPVADGRWARLRAQLLIEPMPDPSTTFHSVVAGPWSLYRCQRTTRTVPDTMVASPIAVSSQASAPRCGGRRVAGRHAPRTGEARCAAAEAVVLRGSRSEMRKVPVPRMSKSREGVISTSRAHRACAPGRGEAVAAAASRWAAASVCGPAR